MGGSHAWIAGMYYWVDVRATCRASDDASMGVDLFVESDDAYAWPNNHRSRDRSSPIMTIDRCCLMCRPEVTY